MKSLTVDGGGAVISDQVAELLAIAQSLVIPFDRCFDFEVPAHTAAGDRAVRVQLGRDYPLLVLAAAPDGPLPADPGCLEESMSGELASLLQGLRDVLEGKTRLHEMAEDSLVQYYKDIRQAGA